MAEDDEATQPWERRDVWRVSRSARVAGAMDVCSRLEYRSGRWQKKIAEMEG